MSAGDTRRLTEIRDLLAWFDRQLALEAIERIVEDGHDGERVDYRCAQCGALIGHFIGHGDGWHHYRGDGTPGSPVELYDAGHEATFPGGAS